jgi:integrase
VSGGSGKFLAAGVGEPTVVKAYQLLRALMNTAVDDGLIRPNPCRVKGADRYDVPERPVLTVAEVFAVSDSIAPRYRLLVLLAAFTALRFGELAALRRRDVDLEGLTVTVRRAQAELQGGRIFDKAPKSAAGCALSPSRPSGSTRPRTTWSTSPLPAVTVTSSSGRRAGSCGGATSGTTGSRPGRPRASRPSCTSNDLRHTGNTLASTAGASTRELMTRMGHSSSRAALDYQHMTSDRDRAIVDRLGVMIRDGGGGVPGQGVWHPCGSSGTRVARPRTRRRASLGGNSS